MEPLERRWLLDGGPIISEFLASNSGSLLDEDGDSSDWVEIKNTDDTPVDLEGWFLTDSPGDPTPWRFPSVVIQPGGHLVVFASNKDRPGTGPKGELHADFSLDAAGEYLALGRPDDTLAGEFAPAFPPQREDISFGIGQSVLPDRPVPAGSLARWHVPANNALGLSWTGAEGNEPFDDSMAAGWNSGPTGLGYDAVDVGGQMQVVGNTPAPRASLDASAGGVYLLETSPFTQAGQITSWSFYSTTTRSITPLVLQLDEQGDYVVTGIGATRTSSGVGTQTFSFALVAGSVAVGAGYYFGWRDGSPSTSGAGVVPYSVSAAASVRLMGAPATLAAGQSLGPGNAAGRVYSIQATATVIETPSPFGYWSFDEADARDDSGNGHNGTNNGATPSNSVPPAVGQGRSMQFDGAGDFISAQINVSETTYTSAFWFKADVASRGMFTVVDSDLGGGGHDRHLYLNGGNIASRTWNDETITSSGNNFVDGQWHHVAHVFGGAAGGQKIYVDGQLVASGNKSFSDFDWQQRINIGFSNDGAGDFFQGLIDEVAVWNQSLSVAQIQSLAAGASPLALGGYSSLIATDVEAAAKGVNASMYVRMPFEVSGPVDYDALILRVKYDDGFVAYLNGEEVARRNAPAVVAYNSTALGDRAAIDALRYEDIDLSGRVDLLRSGTNILAFQALNDSVGGDDLLLLPELVTVRNTPDQYLSPPTPGSANVSGVFDFVADTSFSRDRGYYDAPFDVTITTATPGAAIVYTTDGSTPSPTNGTLVPAPNGTTPPSAVVPINGTTNLRAMAFKAGFEPTNVDTHTYIFIYQVAVQPNNPPGVSGWSDFQVDPDVVNTTLPGYSFREALLAIPTVSITTEIGNLFGNNGIYTNSTSRGAAWERAASIEWFNPDGTTEFQIDAGIRMHGNSSRDHGFIPKHPIRVLFKSQYGPSKLRHQVFADSEVDAFDQILLRGASTDAWPVVDGGSRWVNERATYIRDQWVRDAQNALGHPSAHGTYVHLYLNGLYWGLYNPSERPTSSFMEEYFGGDKDEWDVLKDFAELREGTKDAWNQMFALADAGLSSDAAYQRIQGNNPDGTRNPNFPVYLDVPNLIDYMILHIYIGAEDWQQHNWWAARRRGPESTGFKFFAWDQEISNESLTRTTTLAGGRFEDGYYNVQSPSYLYGRLLSNATFRLQIADRLHEVMFNDGPLTPQNAEATWLARQQEIDQAIVAESARWGDARDAVPHKRETRWLPEMDWMHNNYWSANWTRVLADRFRRVNVYPNVDAPAFNKHGGLVESGFKLNLTAPAGTLYYTLDGTDPRQPNGSVAPGALIYNGTTTTTGLISRGATWRYLDNNPDLSAAAWTTVGFSDASWKQGPAQLGYGDGDEATVVGYGGNPDNKHITTYFRHSFQVSNPGQFDSLTLQLLRDDGAIVYLNGQQVAGSNMPEGAIGRETPARTTIVDEAEGQWIGYSLDPSLLIAGTNVIAVELHQSDPASSDLSFDLRLAAAVTTAPPVELSESTQVNSRVLGGGTWSALNHATFLIDAPPLAISEIHYAPADPSMGSPYIAGDFEFIELYNPGPGTVDLAGIQFTNGISFDFTTGDIASLPADGYLVVVKNQQAFLSRYPGFDSAKIAGEYTGSLDNSGERLRLEDAFAQTIVDFRYESDWHPLTLGHGFSLTSRDPAQTIADLEDKDAWRPSSRLGGSPSGPDTGEAPPPGAIVINEILTHTDEPDGDWIELYNTTGDNIPIGGWYLSDRRNNPTLWRIPDDTTLPAGEYLVFTQAAHFGGAFALSEFGSDDDDGDPENDERVVLTAAIRIDASTDELIGFQSDERFGAADREVTIGRFQKGTGGFDFVALQSATPEGANAPPIVGPVVFHEFMYNPGPGGDEYLELKNITAGPVPLYDPLHPENTWALTDGVNFVFPPGMTLAGGQIALVVPLDPAAFRSKYGVPASVPIFGPYSGALNDGGDDPVQLTRPGEPELDGFVPMIAVERIRYGDNFPWPEAADGDGASLQRIDAAAYGNDAINWIASHSGGTPGNTPPQVAQVLLASTQWTPQMLDRLAAAGFSDAGVPLADGAAQLQTLAWAGIDQIRVRFTRDVVVASEDLVLAGANRTVVPIATFDYDAASHNATWTLSGPLRVDRILLSLASTISDAAGFSLDGNWSTGVNTFPSGNGVIESDDTFRFRFDLLPADFDGNDVVSRDDVAALVRAIGLARSGSFDPHLDLTGDGRLSIADVRTALHHLGSTLPADEPQSDVPQSALMATDAVFQRLGGQGGTVASVATDDRRSDGAGEANAATSQGNAASRPPRRHASPPAIDSDGMETLRFRSGRRAERRQTGFFDFGL